MEKAISLHSLNMDREDEERAARQNLRSDSTANLLHDDGPATTDATIENTYDTVNPT